MSPSTAHQPIDTPPPAEVGEPAPDELDKLIAEKFPEADEEARAKIKARALKQHGRRIASESHRQAPIVSRIEEAPTIEGLNLMRSAILYGLHRGTLDPDKKTMDRWQNAIWGKVVQLMLQAERPADLCYIANFVRAWPKEPAVEQLIQDTFKLHVARLPNEAEWLLQQGIEIEGHTKLP